MRGTGIRMALAGLAAGALALLLPTAAWASNADDPVDLGGAYVLDRSGVLNDPAAVQDAIDALYSERGTQLFVVFVDRFEGAASDQDWAHESAERSGLGDHDILLAIATQDRVYRYSVTDAFPLSDDQLARVAEDHLVPELRVNDWQGGAIAFAQGLTDAQAPSLFLPIAGGVLGVGAVTGIVVAGVRKRRATKRTQDAAEANAAELERRAGVALVELDDALKTSEQELGFAQAEFGEDHTRDFAAALADARAMAKQAFELRQKLDDAFPETPEQRRTMTLQLIEFAEKADATLDAQADAFDALRELDRNAPQVLEQVAAEQAGLAARIDQAEARIAELGAAHPKADLSTVRDVPAQARRLAGFAATAVADARAELAKPKGEAAVAVRAAQQAVGQVTQLLGSVDSLAGSLAEQARQNAETAAQLESAMQTARSAVTATQDYITTNRGAVGATARTRISEAERRLDEARTLAATDATAALAQAREAERFAGDALRAARADVDAYTEQAAIRDYGRSSPEELARYSEADGASLGGILSDLLFGGSSGGGWSGSSGSSSSSGGWNWGGGWSSSRPSGFGGSSRRSSGSSHRSSSSHSSGGRRGGGGRF